jgi:hypothetical protein
MLVADPRQAPAITVREVVGRNQGTEGIGLKLVLKLISSGQ